MVYGLGNIFSKFDVRDYKAVVNTSLLSFPKEFELQTVRVKSQGSVGSCGAHVLSSIVEYFNLIQHNIRTEMSTGYIYGNRKKTNHKGSGMVLRDALATLKEYGDVYESDFPYNVEMPDAGNKFNKSFDSLYEKGYPFRISAYYRVKTIPEMKAALRMKYPIAIGVKWYDDMEVKNGILTTNFNIYRGGHCLFIYGWNEIGWKVQNSWSNTWGKNGRCIIPYDMKIHEAWAVVDNIKDGVVLKKPYSSKVGKIVPKAINTIGNIKIRK